MRTIVLIFSLGLAACSSSPIAQYCASLALCVTEDCELSPEACEELRQGEQDVCEAELKSTRDIIATGDDAACSKCLESMDRYYQCASDIPTCTDFYNAQIEDCDGEYEEYMDDCSPDVQAACGRGSGQDTGGSTGTGGPGTTGQSGTTSPSGTNTATSSTSPCNNAVLVTHPAEGATDVFYRTAVEFQLAAPEPGATLTLVDQAGREVLGTSSVNGSTVVFTPYDLLDSDTGYTATLDWACEPSVSVSWATTDVGPAVDASDLIGRSYSVSLGSGRFVEPPGVGVLLGSMIEFNMLIGVTNATGDRVYLRGSMSSEASSTEQDMCVTTLEYPPADFSQNPFFEMAADSLPLKIAGFDTAFEDMVLSGAISPDYTRVEGVTLSATIDTRPFVDMISPGGDESAVCTLMVTFGVDCEACSDGTGDYCLGLHVDSMVAEERSGAPIVEVTEEDLKTNPACDE